MNMFPEPYNPDNLLAPDPGYRYLGKGEMLKESDEWVLSINEPWCKTSHAGRLVGDANFTSNTYRRAINVDDPRALPPAEWVRPGYTVISGPLSGELRGMLLESRIERWDITNQCWSTGWTGDDPYYYRYPTPAVNPEQPISNTMNPSPGQSIIIKVGDKQALSHAVQEIAFEAGWRWPGNSKKLDGDAINIYGKNAFIGLKPHKEMTFGGNPSSWSGENIILDARTELGKLIDLLSEANKPKLPPEPILKGADGKMYTAEYIKNGPTISFGCAKIDISLIEEIALLINGSTPPKTNGSFGSNYMRSENSGNRNVKSITLNSGAVIHGNEAKVILEYVYAVNAAK